MGDVNEVERQWRELNGLPAALPMVDDVPSNCWTCEHNGEGGGTMNACLLPPCGDPDGMAWAWAEDNCLSHPTDEALDGMPPRDVTGCPGYERAGVEVIRNPDREAFDRIRAALGLGDASAQEVAARVERDIADAHVEIRRADHGETTEAEDRLDAMVRFLDSDEARKELESGALMGGPIARRNIITRWQERKQALDAANDALSRIASALGMEDASAQEVAQEVERAADARKTGRLYVDVALLEQAQRERDEARAELASVRGQLEAERNADHVAHMGAEKRAHELRRELDAEREAHAETRERLEDFAQSMWSVGRLTALRGDDVWTPAMVVAAVKAITDSHAALVAERERVAAFVHDMAFDGALDARDGMARGWDVLERLSDVAQAGGDALAAAAAEWGER